MEEGLDVAELCRGMLAETLSVNVSLKTAWLEVCKVPLVGVTDAKDTFDRVTQDVGFGTQKEVPRVYSCQHSTAVDLRGQTR